ncbi:hypothetical protein, partial [Enterobacter intestinihominis]
DNGEAEVPGGGFAVPGQQKKLPEQVGPVSAPPPGLNAGSLVGSCCHTPALTQSNIKINQPTIIL